MPRTWTEEQKKAAAEKRAATVASKKLAATSASKRPVARAKTKEVTPTVYQWSLAPETALSAFIPPAGFYVHSMLLDGGKLDHIILRPSAK